MRSGGSDAAAIQTLGSAIGPTSGMLQARTPAYPPSSTPNVADKSSPNRTYRPGAGRSSSQSPLQAQVTASRATGIAARPQLGIISSWTSPTWANPRAIEITRATTPAVIPRGITIPQNCPTAKTSGKDKASQVNPVPAASAGQSPCTSHNGTQMIASPMHQVSIFASQTVPGRAP